MIILQPWHPPTSLFAITGNLLVAPGTLFLIDWEFATIGPLSFDLGCLLGNLMLAILSLQGMAEVARQQQQQQEEGRREYDQDQQAHPQGDQQACTRKQQADWLMQVGRAFRPSCPFCWSQGSLGHEPH